MMSIMTAMSARITKHWNTVLQIEKDTGNTRAVEPATVIVSI